MIARPIAELSKEYGVREGFFPHPFSDPGFLEKLRRVDVEPG
jgi:hypothetical protein